MGRITRHDRIVSALLEWGGTELRDLPWRRTSDPWHVLVSEVMLQQTSVARVLPKYEAFIQAFPTPADMANAPLGEALALWQGLGYPRRCRNLRDAAAVIASEHGGVMPDTLDGLLALPGIGQYTARAVLAFAHAADVAVVDTNVSRVLSRLDNTVLGAKALQQLADQLVPAGQSWMWNQIIMDFGARQCTLRSPLCSTCPAKRHCKWRGSTELPDPAPQSSGASKPQARFDGSDRQARGRVMRALGERSCTMAQLVEAMQLENDTERATRLVNALTDEGLVVRRGSRFALP